MESRNGALCRTGRVAEADSVDQTGRIEREGVVASNPEATAVLASVPIAQALPDPNRMPGLSALNG